MSGERRTDKAEMIAASAILEPLRQRTECRDEELVAEVRAGSNAAFAELTARYRGRIETLCHRFFSDREMVRDLTQESFLRAYTGLEGYRADLPFAGWLRSIAINACYDELRRRRRRPEELVGDLAIYETGWSALVNRSSPEDLADLAEQRRDAYVLAHRLLDTLRPEDRLVLTLKESEEMSTREIAETMGWSVAKVKVRAFRARRAMRQEADRILKKDRGPAQ